MFVNNMLYSLLNGYAFYMVMNEIISNNINTTDYLFNVESYCKEVSPAFKPYFYVYYISKLWEIIDVILVINR
eukprot:UN10975